MVVVSVYVYHGDISAISSMVRLDIDVNIPSSKRTRTFSMVARNAWLPAHDVAKIASKKSPLILFTSLSHCTSQSITTILRGKMKAMMILGVTGCRSPLTKARLRPIWRTKQVNV
ncbi:predicted protein [Sclerotinia sclerotiorum 1980 UF-70]|uniref:Uncharacterized protein n=1 Tax=Sclerotinia sclerotiorum (strain ATCC 18683 / 1980 / Ss-1) TaxID=665079 RepID=A7F730_SCLS1|nr:predicted protein [Sclerotinia sclerotiorum 1980 UF-70]EDN98551.1 predicted protein [Sclerotinia sclerotiorum 1980 UF-70]